MRRISRSFSFFDYQLRSATEAPSNASLLISSLVRPRHNNSLFGVLVDVSWSRRCLSHKNVQVGLEDATSARYAMATTLGKMLEG